MKIYYKTHGTIYCNKISTRICLKKQSKIFNYFLCFLVPPWELDFVFLCQVIQAYHRLLDLKGTHQDVEVLNIVTGAIIEGKNDIERGTLVHTPL